MYLIIVILLKIILFLVPYRFFQAYVQQGSILERIEADQTGIYYYVLTNAKTPQRPAVITMSLQQEWMEGSSYPVAFRLESWGNNIEPLTITVMTVPELSGLAVPVRFEPGFTEVFTHTVTLAPGSVNGLVRAQFITQLEQARYYFIAPADEVTLVDEVVYQSHERARIFNLILLIITFVAWLAIVIYVW